MKTSKVKIGIIGGSGLYNMEGGRLIREVSVKTPFGRPSDSVALVDVGSVTVAFLPRHGKGHKILPSEINGRANIFALKSLGVEQIIGVGATGSLREELAPMHLVVPEQLLDKTCQRVSTFFGQGLVAHIGFDRPFCPRLGAMLAQSAGELALPVHSGGVYVCMEGPAFSTKAESNMNRLAGGSVIGMTALPEAKLAREAEICYASLVFVTDYDCWKEGEEAVNAHKVIAQLREGAARVQRVFKILIPYMAAAKREEECSCSSALATALVTDPKYINKLTAQKLKFLVGKYLSKV